MRKTLSYQLAVAGVGLILAAGLGFCAGGGYTVQETRLGTLDAHMDSPAFSRDGRHLAYAARRGHKWVVVADGVAGPEYDDIGAGTPLFSADGRRVAYAAQQGDHWRVIVDGMPGPDYDGVGALVFSADGRQVAYTAKQGDKMIKVTVTEEADKKK